MPTARTDRSPWETGLTIAGVIVTILVHAAIALAFARFDEEVVPIEGRIKRSVTLCTGGRRCPALAWHRPRGGIDEGPAARLDIIQAAIIPRLGGVEQKKEALPRLETPKVLDPPDPEINIAERPDPPIEAKPLTFPEKKKRRRPVRRKPSLSGILGKRDPDMRKREKGLDELIGHREGSVHGTGTTFTEGSRWAGRVKIAFQEAFNVPASIDDKTLRKQKVEILISGINDKGEVLAFEIKRRAPVAAYNTACVQLIKRFMPDEGGALTLPAPTPDVIDFIKRNGFLVKLDGNLFKRR